MQNIFWDSGIQTNHLIPVRMNLELIKKKKITCRQEDFAIPEDHGRKIEEGEKIDNYLDIAKELKRCGT